MSDGVLKHSLASRIFYDDSRGKNREVTILNGFLKRLQFFQFHVETSEKPDFFLRFNNHESNVAVGLEVTEYYAEVGRRGAMQAKFVQKWKRFAKALRLKLDSEGFPHLYGAIHFKSDGWLVLDGFNLDAFITEICLAVKESKGQELTPSHDDPRFPILSNRVDHIFLADTKAETGILWWPAHLQSGALNDPLERLIQIVVDKSQRQYDWKSVEEKWLLIYCGSDGLANTIIRCDNPEIQRRLVGTVFDRVYVWNKRMEIIDEICPNFQNVFSAKKNILRRRDYPPKVRSFVTSTKPV